MKKSELIKFIGGKQKDIAIKLKYVPFTWYNLPEVIEGKQLAAILLRCEAARIKIPKELIS